jgi:hypothetical protein
MSIAIKSTGNGVPGPLTLGMCLMWYPSMDPRDLFREVSHVRRLLPTVPIFLVFAALLLHDILRYNLNSTTAWLSERQQVNVVAVDYDMLTMLILALHIWIS